MTEEKQLPTVVDVSLVPVISIEEAKQKLKALQEFVQSYLIPNIDYGKQPGTEKEVLFLPGAQKLMEIYGFNADPIISQQVEDWDREPPLFDYTIKTLLTRKSDGLVVGHGMGSCNSYEAKYKWRQAERVCPDCGKAAIIKGRVEYGGGWLCFAKKGGCGTKYDDDDTDIMDQPLGKVPNENIADQKNTVLKMAKKRSLVDAVIAATRSSGLFTQDMDDFVDAQVVTKTSPKPQTTTSTNAGTHTKISEMVTVTSSEWDTLDDVAASNRWPMSYVTKWKDSARKSGKSDQEIYERGLERFGQPNDQELTEAKA